jgi:hypothetical protein
VPHTQSKTTRTLEKAMKVSIVPVSGGVEENSDEKVGVGSFCSGR